MKIAIASDHGGFELKENLKKYYENQTVNLIDLGTSSTDACDYPDLAEIMCKKILAGLVDLGILICGTGIGISIAANRNNGIRAAVLYSDEVAELTRLHNNANIAVFGARTMTFDDVVKRIDIFLNTDFEAGRHLVRINKLDNFEKGMC